MDECDNNDPNSFDFQSSSPVFEGAVENIGGSGGEGGSSFMDALSLLGEIENDTCAIINDDIAENKGPGLLTASRLMTLSLHGGREDGDTVASSRNVEDPIETLQAAIEEDKPK